MGGIRPFRESVQSGGFDNYDCYMTGQNLLIGSVYVYKFLCLPENWLKLVHRLNGMKNSSNKFTEVNIFDTFLISPSRERK